MDAYVHLPTNSYTIAKSTKNLNHKNPQIKTQTQIKQHQPTNHNQAN